MMLNVCRRKTQGEIGCCIEEKYLPGEILLRAGSMGAGRISAFK